MYYNDVIKEFFHNLGVPLVGFADLAPIDQEARHSLRYGISIALPHYNETLEKIAAGASVEALCAVNARNKEIKDISVSGEEFIKSQGFKAISQANVKRNADFKTPLSHKTIATLAGVGYIGKSGLLVTSEYGPAVRLSSILTDMPFKTGKPTTDSGCGECRTCVDVCPGGALLNHLWSVGSERSDIMDLRLCNEEIKRRQEMYDVTGDAICGLCVAVCPKARGV